MSVGDGVDNGRRSLVLKILSISVIAIILISTAVFFFNLNGKSLDFSNSELLVVPTGSMDGEPRPFEIPTIPKDSMVMVHRLSDDQKADLRVGDVITFHQGGINKVHRIIEIDTNAGTIVTKGDANQSEDPQISFSDVTGKVVGVSTVVGGAVSFMREAVHKSPILLIIGAVLVVLIIYTAIEVILMVRNGDDTEE